ncbi:MAG: adenylyltransferase/cytidyltransferase family protein [Candidatus Paceibacterota bacterium]
MYAKIISLEDFKKLRNTEDLGKIVCTSGGFDPIHPGHMSCICESKKYGDTLVVIVNGDNFLKNKKGKPFMDLETRVKIVSFLSDIDYVIPFEIEDDSSVVVALEAIRPHVFTKGGDRNIDNIPEADTIRKYNIEIVHNVGLPKYWSSSDFLRDWTDFSKNK